MTREQRKTILVTGAGGFIGGFLCKRLIDEGFSVKALTMPEESADHLERMGCSIFRGDLTKTDSIRGICDGVETVYHLAARVTYWGTRKDFYDAIYEATKHLLEESSGSGPPEAHSGAHVSIQVGRTQGRARGPA